MKFCDDTLLILKNFATINQSLILKEGDILKTISPQKTIVSQASIAENIPSDAAIYDLPRFLVTLSLFNSPEIDFKQNKFVISDAKNRANYTYADQSMILSPPTKTLNIGKADVKIDSLDWQSISSVIKASAILQLSEVAFVGDGKNIRLSAINSKNPTADVFDTLVGVTDKVFQLIIKVENLKLMPVSYEVEISATNGIAYFKSDKIQYWIVLEHNSKFGG